jgi:DNA repair photolyase
MAPIVPGFSSSRTKLERTIKAIAEHGARFVGCNGMYLQDGTRTHFMNFIERAFPSMRPRFEKLYAKTYPPETYRKEVKAMVSVLQERYGMRRREEADGRAELSQPSEDQDATQVGFAW